MSDAANMVNSYLKSRDFGVARKPKATLKATTMIKKTILICLVATTVCLLARAQDQEEPKRAPSTQEERKRFVAIVHKMEQTPLDSALTPDIEWALKWLQDIPDINVSICPAPLGSLVDENYEYRSRISVQFTLAMGVYLIENPQKAADTVSQYLAGVESAVKTYKAILKSKPQAKSRAMDELVAKEAEGELPDFVRDASKYCEDTSHA
jgi:hypothetical protein